MEDITDPEKQLLEMYDPEGQIKDMEPVDKHQLFLRLEEWTDSELAAGRISQEEAWDLYFGLLHECDESGFRGDRPRILAKIDTQSYNPFNSANPGVVILARIRLAHMKD